MTAALVAMVVTVTVIEAMGEAGAGSGDRAGVDIGAPQA
jgi:hypothetical protein